MQKFHSDLIGKYWIKKCFHDRKTIDHTKYRCITSVTISVDGELYVGESRCSIKDQWVRKIGYKIALGRALKNAAINHYITDEVDNNSYKLHR
jgi:hypothetical protein